jgi:hypothetical protein
MYCSEQNEVHGVERSSTASESGLIIEETSSVKRVLFAIVLGSEAPSGKVDHPTVNIE